MRVRDPGSKMRQMVLQGGRDVSRQDGRNKNLKGDAAERKPSGHSVGIFLKHATLSWTLQGSEGELWN